MNGRRRLSYPGYGSMGYSDMGMPSGPGSKALERMAGRGSPPSHQDDPLWKEIESTFSDILGDYADMDLDMPIQPPNMEDPQDQLRYLKDLEALGMSSAPSAAMMKQQGVNLSQALQIVKYQHQLEKENTDMMMKLLPMLEGSPELQATMSAQLMNKMMPGQFDVQDKSLFGGLFGEEPGVTRIDPENVTKGMVFEGISGAITPEVLELTQRAKETRSEGDAQAVNDYLNNLIDQLSKGGMNREAAEAIADKIYADVVSQVKGDTF